ncbi:MAG: glycosyl transferase [Flavobacterium sp.]|nr:glycosyl transferase [Flavobacterium sp.]
MDRKIVVAIPCYNEELAIDKVIADFKKEIPEAEILVVDNNSSDRTAEIAEKAGARVISEKKQGKGYAVQKIFDEFSGDILILVDGDDTYLASDAQGLLRLVVNDEADMAVGDRIHSKNNASFSNSHWLGNKFLTMSLNLIFGTRLRDMESGFRVIDKKFVESSALLAGGFGIEPELTIQALEKGMRIKEIPISLLPRESGSHSKLNAVKDGTIVLYTVISLFRDYKPLHFFSLISSVFLLLGFILGWYSTIDYFKTGIVFHIPALIVSGFFILFSFISFVSGLTLSSIKRRHDELLVILNRKRREVPLNNL